MAFSREVAHLATVVAALAVSMHAYPASFRRFESSWNSTLMGFSVIFSKLFGLVPFIWLVEFFVFSLLIVF